MKWRGLVMGVISLLLAGSLAAATLTESQKVDLLISKIAELKGAVFIRNGTEHGAKEAAEHLQLKRGKAGKRFDTAEQFIECCASKSSLSGSDYLIRFSDGHTEKAGDFLRQQLKQLD